MEWTRANGMEDANGTRSTERIIIQIAPFSLIWLCRNWGWHFSKIEMMDICRCLFVSRCVFVCFSLLLARSFCHSLPLFFSIRMLHGICQHTFWLSWGFVGNPFNGIYYTYHSVASQPASVLFLVIFVHCEPWLHSDFDTWKCAETRTPPNRYTYNIIHYYICS